MIRQSKPCDLVHLIVLKQKLVAVVKVMIVGFQSMLPPAGEKGEIHCFPLLVFLYVICKFVTNETTMVLLFAICT